MTLLLLAIQFSHGRRFDVPQDNNADDEKIDSGLPGARFIELKREKKVGLEGFSNFNEREKRQTDEKKCQIITNQVFEKFCLTEENKRELCGVVANCRLDPEHKGCTYFGR